MLQHFVAHVKIDKALVCFQFISANRVARVWTKNSLVYRRILLALESGSARHVKIHDRFRENEKKRVSKLQKPISELIKFICEICLPACLVTVLSSNAEKSFLIGPRVSFNAEKLIDSL